MKPLSSSQFTYEDLLNFPDDGRRHEIIDGEHYVTPSPNTSHQTIVLNVAAAIRAFLAQQPLGAVFVAPFDVLFSDLNVVEPDLLYVSRERQAIVTHAHVKGAPDLVVEVLSSSTRRVDEITKRKLYERFDVREFWIVDPELEAVKIYRRSGASFGRPLELTLERDERLTTPMLPGFEIPLRAVFAPPFASTSPA
jgi:Uma2 family endonuclease